MMDGISAYREHTVTTESKGRLIVLLYDGAIKFLRLAQQELDAGDFAKKGEYIGKAVDIIIELDRCDAPFEHRLTDVSIAELPVPPELLVYTTDELRRMREQQNPFVREADRVVLSVFARDAGAQAQ